MINSAEGIRVTGISEEQRDSPVYPLEKVPGTINKETEGGQYTVCKAMEERINKANEITRIDTLTETIKDMMKNLNLSLDKALSVLSISEADKLTIMKRF